MDNDTYDDRNYVQQKFNKEVWSESEWKYNHRKTGKPYIVYSLDG